nr:lipoprotein, NLP/P60 family [Streptococcus thermophilus]
MGFTVRPAQATAWTSLRFRSVVPAAACAVTLSIASSSTTAVAQEAPVTSIISEISQHEAEIDRLNLEIGGLAETVNQALVDLHDAQSLAEQARRGASEARDRLDATNVDVERAQKDLDGISRSAYRSSNSAGAPVHADGDARKDSLDRQTYLRKESEGKRATLDELQRARTQAANEESTLRQASKLADERERAAATAETDARETLESSLASLNEQVVLRDDALGNLATAQETLGELRPEAAPETIPPQGADQNANQTQAPADAPATEEVTEQTEQTEQPADSTGAAEGAAASETGEAANDGATPPATESDAAAEEESPAESSVESEEAEESQESEPSSGVTEDVGAAETAEEAPAAPTRPSLDDLSDPETVQSAVEAFSRAVGEAQPDHGSFDDPYTEGEGEIASTSSSEEADNAVAEADEESGTAVAEVLPEVMDAAQSTEEIRGAEEPAAASAREDQIEAVIARAESQIGTPYVWGGGNANGPTTGIPDGVNAHTGQAGYDCSGLVLYAYSGAGIDLPHYTGYQYQRGAKIPAAQAERGDLLFWGDGGSQHVAIYLGDGMMLEAPQSGMNVQKSPVRHSGLAPYAVRLI